MRTRHFVLTLSFLTLCANCSRADTDRFTPLVASTLTAEVRPFPGTDGRLHAVYELVFTNANSNPATLKRIDVIDAADQSKILAAYEGRDVLSRLRSMDNAPVENAIVEYNGSRLFLIDFALDSGTVLPSRFVHRLQVEAPAKPGREAVQPALLSYLAAPVAISQKLPEIGSPLAGSGWVALNGCCGPGESHRSTSLALNGNVHYAQRFAIDWMQLDKNGFLVHGPASDVHNYPCYGADVLAVADGVVVDTLDNLDDQIPGTLPDRKTITLENVDGNHVVLDLGNGVFAFYAHLQKGSVSAKPGDKVKRGRVLGKVGNTGNTSAPHLHFHLMEGASILGSNGIPYVIDRFAIAGQIPAPEFAAAKGVEGDWSKGLFPTRTPMRRKFPLNLNIVDFPDRRSSGEQHTASEISFKPGLAGVQ